ncbi:hypothetical protein [Streptomyces albicerus]
MWTAACTGFLYALATAADFFAVGTADTVLVALTTEPASGRG